jgi:hypothetical protein
MVSVHASGSGDACGPAVQQMLGGMLRELTTALGAANARAALVGNGAQALAPGTAPQAAPQTVGPVPCGSGSCKHGRVCNQGACVEPR